MSRGGSQPGRWAKHEVTEEEAGRTVQEILTGPLRVSRRMIQRLTRSDGIRLNRHATHLQRRVRAGEVVAARVASAEEAGLEPVEMPLDVVYEDADLIAVNKAPFLLVHPVAPHHRATLAHGLTHHFLAQGLHTRVRPVHRLDRDTSGLMLVAKSAFVQQILDRQLRDREMRREYLALVAGVVEAEEGTVDAPIDRHPSGDGRFAVVAGGKPSVTHYDTVEAFRAATLLDIDLETGRTHQIRVHMSAIRHPCAGDMAYGADPTLAERLGLRRQWLHAVRLGFEHPTRGDWVQFESPYPDDLARALEIVSDES